MRDSLQLEMVVAQYCLRMRDVLTSTGVRVGDVVGPAVAAELERHGDPLSRAILRGVAHLGLGATAARSAEAVPRLEERTIGLPQQFAGVGRSRPVGAWRSRGGQHDEFALFTEFEHPRGRRHAIALFVEPRRGGRAKHIGLLCSMDELDPHQPFHPTALKAIDIPAAGVLMRQALERSYGPGAARTDDYRALIATARAHSMMRRVLAKRSLAAG